MVGASAGARSAEGEEDPKKLAMDWRGGKSEVLGALRGALRAGEMRKEGAKAALARLTAFEEARGEEREEFENSRPARYGKNWVIMASPRIMPDGRRQTGRSRIYKIKTSFTSGISQWKKCWGCFTSRIWP